MDIIIPNYKYFNQSILFISYNNNLIAVSLNLSGILFILANNSNF